MSHSRLPNKVTSIVTAFLIFFLYGCTSMQSHNANKPIMELNTDRPGADITTIALDQAKPILCSDACRSDKKCVAWTYVKPGVISVKAYCRTKSEITQAQRSSCCISGVKKDKSG